MVRVRTRTHAHTLGKVADECCSLLSFPAVLAALLRLRHIPPPPTLTLSAGAPALITPFHSILPAYWLAFYFLGDIHFLPALPPVWPPPSHKGTCLLMDGSGLLERVSVAEQQISSWCFICKGIYRVTAWKIERCFIFILPDKNLMR